MTTQSFVNHLPGLWAFFFFLNKKPMLKESASQDENTDIPGLGSILKIANPFWKPRNQTDKQMTPVAGSPLSVPKHTASCNYH